MVSTDSPGLRERKRKRTREAISRAAIELFDSQGFSQTTIPQIAQAADVAPRTVSGYFPHKQELAFPDDEEILQSLTARLTEREEGETAPDALRAWIESWVEERAGHEAELQVRRRVIASDESLQAYELRFRQRAQQTLAAAIARDLGQPPDSLEPRMAAAATMSVFELLEDDVKPGGSEGLELVDRALLFIAAGIRALGDTQPRG